MKMIGKIGLGVVIIAVSALSIHAVQDAPTDANLEKKLVNDYNVYALPLPEKNGLCRRTGTASQSRYPGADG